jgi:hypothetical protein
LEAAMANCRLPEGTISVALHDGRVQRLYRRRALAAALLGKLYECG